MTRPTSLIPATLLLLPLATGPGIAEDAAFRARLEYCSLLTRCELPAPAGVCSAETSRGLPGVTYDAERCAVARDLAARGLGSDDLSSFGLYRFLGKRYRVEYGVSGQLPLSPPRLAFMLAELPLAAKVLTSFRGTRYTAEYLDPERRHFRGSREGTLSGEATRVAGEPGSGAIVYFGYGQSQVGVWRLGGSSLARLAFAPLPPPARGLTYSLTVVVTPEGAIMNRLMGLRLFRSLVERRIREVVTDIDTASRQLAEQGLPGPSPMATFTAEERARVAEFLTLP
jgi:hypothetical protein